MRAIRIPSEHQTRCGTFRKQQSVKCPEGTRGLLTERENACTGQGDHSKMAAGYVWGKFESDIDMSLSNSSIGADAPAATFGKIAALEDV